MTLLLLLCAACDPVGMSACLDLCAEQPLSETDRATCRLNCSNGYREAPTPAVDPRISRATHCMGACYAADGGPDARATCLSSCQANGESLPADVLTALSTCVDGCQKEPAVGEDDRATCRLVCSQTVNPKP